MAQIQGLGGVAVRAAPALPEVAGMTVSLSLETMLSMLLKARVHSCSLPPEYPPAAMCAHTCGLSARSR